MDRCLFGPKPLSETVLVYHKLGPWEQISVKFQNSTFTHENETIVYKMADILPRL